MFGFIYLMWATVPLSIGGSKQFDAGKLLMYPITLRKLFAVDFLSELTTLHSVFAIPAVIAICIGVGFGTGHLTTALIAAFPAILFGVALSKWLSTTIGSLLRRKRARGETIVALIGAVAGLERRSRRTDRADTFQARRIVSIVALDSAWSRGVLVSRLRQTTRLGYAARFHHAERCMAWPWLLQLTGSRVALHSEWKDDESRKRSRRYRDNDWLLRLATAAFLAGAFGSCRERSALRDAQCTGANDGADASDPDRHSRHEHKKSGGGTAARRPTGFLTYGSGLLATGGVLYVFLILAGLSCNLFAFEEGGMRTLILSPIDRRKILLGKNIAITLLALIFATILLTLNTIVFRDLDAPKLLFIGLSFVTFAALSATMGNWLSIRFPKRMRFGKRLNVSGVAGLLLIPMVDRARRRRRCWLRLSVCL